MSIGDADPRADRRLGSAEPDEENSQRYGAKHLGHSKGHEPEIPPHGKRFVCGHELRKLKSSLSKGS